MSRSAINTQGKKEEGAAFMAVAFVFPGDSRPCFAGGGWTSACRWKIVNEFLILLR